MQLTYARRYTGIPQKSSSISSMRYVIPRTQYFSYLSFISILSFPCPFIALYGTPITCACLHPRICGIWLWGCWSATIAIMGTSLWPFSPLYLTPWLWCGEYNLEYKCGRKDSFRLHKHMLSIRLCILTEGLAVAVVFVIVIVLTSLFFCYFLVDTWPWASP